MMRLYFVGDGERDAAMLPPLVENLLKMEVKPKFDPWRRLHNDGRSGGRGYGKKLTYALLRARRESFQAVVAVVDRDKAPQGVRLGELRKAREDDRTKRPPIPTALGEAAPHAEAWLLDDEVAVRKALNLPADAKIPTVKRNPDPKEDLVKLICHDGDQPHDRLQDAYASIAKQVDPSRCPQKKETGFETFVKEVREELGSLREAPKS